MCTSRTEVVQECREHVRSRILIEERSFRWEVLGVLLLLIPALAAAAQPVAGPVEAGSKPAWRWSVDERLARRFDPESMKARATERAAKLEDFETDSPAPEQDLFCHPKPRTSEKRSLFGAIRTRSSSVTIELFDHLLDIEFSSGGTEQQESRRLIEERAVVLGFGRDLWDRLERAAAPFLKLQRREEQLPRSGSLPSRSADGSDDEPVKHSYRAMRGRRPSPQPKLNSARSLSCACSTQE